MKPFCIIYAIKNFLKTTKNVVINILYTSSPFCSFTQGFSFNQSRSKNIEWKIPEINNSQVSK
jgi:hypothetical protein